MLNISQICDNFDRSYLRLFFREESCLIVVRMKSCENTEELNARYPSATFECNHRRYNTVREISELVARGFITEQQAVLGNPDKFYVGHRSKEPIERAT